MEFLRLYIMFNQKSQDIAVTDGIVKILFSEEQLALPDRFFGIFGVNSGKRAKGNLTICMRVFSFSCEEQGRFFTVLCFIIAF